MTGNMCACERVFVLFCVLSGGRVKSLKKNLALENWDRLLKNSEKMTDREDPRTKQKNGET